MNEQELTQIRHVIESQFRLQLCKDAKFPYLQSLGIEHLVQGFHNTEKGFVGILHLFWVKSNGKNIWLSEWLDEEEEGEKLALKIRQESPIDGDKLTEVINRKVKEVMSKNLNEALQDRVKDVLEKTKNEDEPEEGVLLN